MLRITPSVSASRAKSYYSTADYYTEGQELIGHWRGKGAERLGLFGTVKQSDWDRLCDNLRPDDGTPLTVRRRSERRIGYDFNFHVPKSLSLMYGLTRDERLLAAFRESVGETMREMEAEAKARVRRGGRNEDRLTGNLVWGEFVHFTARPEEGVPDPHLHAHCFVFNATYDESEGRWKAGQFGDLKRDAPYFEAVFHAKLARRLEELGLETRRTNKGWELAGIDAATITKFSRRTTRIEKLARERGITDPDRKAELGAQTRSGKAKELTMRELDAIWRSRLTLEESAAVNSLTGRIGGAAIDASEWAVAESVDRAFAHGFERASVLPERTLLAAALRQGVGKGSRETIEAMVQSRPLVSADRNGRRLVTTREVLQEERRMLAFVREGRGACRPIDPTPGTFKRDWLNEQQKAAVRHVLDSKDRVILIRGAAGTGKTTMMQEARDAIESAGLHVHAFAPSASASRGVLRQEGFESADTVARLLADRKLQDEVAGSVLWIDEAGLIGTRTMRQLFELAERTGSRVVLSGDRRQHGSVERGAALRLLEEEAGLLPAEIKEIQRQKDRYKAAVKALSEERTVEGFGMLDRLGWIREVADEDRYQAVAEAYLDAVRGGKTALVVSPTHAEGDRITQEIRERMRQEGLLSKEARILSQLVPMNLTLGERQDETSYEPGDMLVFHQNAKGYSKGERVEVGREPLPLDQAERFTVFRRQAIELAPGDRVRITRNGSTRDKRHRLSNGDIFTVKGLTPHGDITLDNGWVVAGKYGHLAHGLVVTSHASQGKTVDRVFIGQSSASFAASSREQFYVSVSRGREQALVFTDSKAELLEAVGRSDERISGTELARDAGVGRRPPGREATAGRARRHPAMTHGRTIEQEAIEHER